MTRSRTARILAVAAYAVALFLWCWLVGIPNDPIGVALWLWLLAICWRLDWSLAVPEGLVAVAAGPRGLRPGARRHRRHRLHALRGVADPRRRVAGPPLGRRRRADGVAAAPLLR